MDWTDQMSDINGMQETARTQASAQGADVRADARAAFEAADGAARQGAQALQQGGRATGEALQQGAGVAAGLTHQGAQAGAEAMRRVGEGATETLRRSTQAVAEGQRQIAQDTAQRFEQVSRKVAQAAQGTGEDMRRLFVLPQAAEGGLRDMQQGIAGLIQGVVQTNLRVTQELFRLANPAAVVELQQRFARGYMDALMQGTVTLTRAVRRTADETLRPLEEQVERTRQARQGHRDAAE